MVDRPRHAATQSPTELRDGALDQVAALRRTVADLAEKLHESREDNRKLRTEREQLRAQLVVSELKAMGGTDASLQAQVHDEVTRVTGELRDRCQQLETTLAQHAARGEYAQAEAAILEEQVVCLQSTIGVLLGESDG